VNVPAHAIAKIVSSLGVDTPLVGANAHSRRDVLVGLTSTMAPVNVSAHKNAAKLVIPLIPKHVTASPWLNPLAFLRSAALDSHGILTSAPVWLQLSAYKESVHLVTPGMPLIVSVFQLVALPKPAQMVSLGVPAYVDAFQALFAKFNNAHLDLSGIPHSASVLEVHARFSYAELLNTSTALIVDASVPLLLPVA